MVFEFHLDHEAGTQFRLFRTGFLSKKYTLYGKERNQDLIWKSKNYALSSTVYQDDEKVASYYQSEGCKTDRTLDIQKSNFDPVICLCFVIIDLCENLYNSKHKMVNINRPHQ